MRVATAVRTGSARSRTRRLVVVTESPVAFRTPAMLAPVSRSTPGEEEEDGDEVRADAAEQRGCALVEPLPHLASAFLPGLGQAAEAERARGEREAGGEQQAGRAGAEGPHGREHGAHDHHRAGGQQPDRDEHVDLPDEVLEAVDERGADGPALPAQVDQEREEHREGDQPEPDQVPVSLLEGRAEPARSDGRAACGGRMRPWLASPSPPRRRSPAAADRRRVHRPASVAEPFGATT